MAHSDQRRPRYEGTTALSQQYFQLEQLKAEFEYKTWPQGTPDLVGSKKESPTEKEQLDELDRSTY